MTPVLTFVKRHESFLACPDGHKRWLSREEFLDASKEEVVTHAIH